MREAYFITHNYHFDHALCSYKCTTLETYNLAWVTKVEMKILMCIVSQKYPNIVLPSVQISSRHLSVCQSFSIESSTLGSISVEKMEVAQETQRNVWGEEERKGRVLEWNVNYEHHPEVVGSSTECNAI